MFGKKPPDLDPYEIAKFNQYRTWKSENGEQIETDIIYNTAVETSLVFTVVYLLD